MRAPIHLRILRRHRPTPLRSPPTLCRWSAPSGNLILGYERPIARNLMLRANLDVLFTADYNPSPNLDKRVEQEGFEKYNARVALADIEGRWEVALIGRNLLDKQVYVYAQDLPSAYIIAETTTYFGFQAPRRTVTLLLSYRW